MIFILFFMYQSPPSFHPQLVDQYQSPLLSHLESSIHFLLQYQDIADTILFLLKRYLQGDKRNGEEVLKQVQKKTLPTIVVFYYFDSALRLCLKSRKFIKGWLEC